jgi:phthiocerol/phenolphthiocerol synthesis type-I polyketide synthase E
VNATPIAIIGMAARLPMSADVEEYWSNLADSRDCISRLTEDDLLAAGAAPADIANPSYVRAAAVIPDAGGFDASFFGMTSHDALVTDPQQRLFLETSYLAAENAGYDPRGMPGAVGVFAGAAHAEYAEHYVKRDRRLHETSGPFAVAIGNHNDYIASSVSYRLNLRGPAVTLGTACSSSLVAVHLACTSLLSGESDMALAGGVCVEMPYGLGYRWLPGSVASRDGIVRPFDAQATGTLFGSGVGVVVLRRLDEAVADGDPIRAVILGSAINNDGAAKVSFSAPSVEGQSAAIVRAMRQAGVRPDQIGYIEAHGTGTSVGDPLEAAGLEHAFRELSDDVPTPGSIVLGSSKGNIGHTGQAAGVAGLIKTVLCLERERIAPTLHFNRLNKSIPADETPFRVAATAETWTRGEAPRFAGVSSFGIGGTNAHVVVTEGPAVGEPAAESTTAEPIVWSAYARAALTEYGSRLSDFLAARPDQDLGAVAATLRRSRAQHRVRAGLVADDAASAAKALADGQYLMAPDEDVPPRRTVFMLPGQGSQYPGMGLGLYRGDAVFAAAADEALAAFSDAGCDVSARWRSGDYSDNDTKVVQPLIFVTSYAVARCLIAGGARPEALVGHSLGELVAGCLAGVMSLKDCARVVAVRGQAMADQPPGRMIAVAADPAQVQSLIGDTVQLAAVNGPRQIVLGTPLAELDAAISALRDSGVDYRVLETSHAFHTPMMQPAVDAVLGVLSDVALAPPQIRLASATTGVWVTEEQALNPAFWADNIARPVYFDTALRTILDEPAVLIEAGPSSALSAAAALQPGVRSGDSVVVATLRRTKQGEAPDEVRSLRTAMTKAWVEGADVRWPVPSIQRIPLPEYPFQRRHYWASASETGVSPSQGRPEATPQRVDVPPAVTTPFTRIGWREAESGPLRTLAANESALVLMPADAHASRRLRRWLRQCGYRVITVTEGPAFAADGDAYTVALDHVADQVSRIMSALPAQRWPSLVVHGLGLEAEWSQPSPEEAEGQLARGVRALVALAQCCLRADPARPSPRLIAMTTQAIDVSGGERLDPFKSSMAGVIKSARREEPRLEATLIDVSEGTTDTTVTGELMQASKVPVVALRDDRRWLPEERPLALGSPAEPAIRPGGVYLITGGLGAIGAAVARALIDTGQEPTIVLVGRSPAPAADGAGGSGSRRLLALRELSADVHYMTADVTNSRDVRRCLDLIAAKFGPVNGVFHAAGRAGGGPLGSLLPTTIGEVLAPKVMGSLVLEQALVDSPALDMFVHFSSRAAINGIAGAADYGAANTFIDAHAQVSRLAKGRVLSVDWPAWGGAGIAIDEQRTVAQDSDGTGRLLGLRTIDLSPGSSWVIDEHQLAGTPLFPGTGYVDLILTALADGLPDISSISVENLVFSTPLPVTAPKSLWLAGQTGNGAWNLRVMSQPADGGGPWVTHTTAQLRDCGQPKPGHLDVPYLISRLAPGEPGDSRAGQGLLTFGPRWKCLTAVYGSAADGEWLCELRLPDQFASDRHRHFAHPALLDVAATMLTTGAEEAHLPYAYERIRAIGAVPGHVFAHVRRTAVTPEYIQGSIDLADAEGNVVLEISGLILRRIPDPDALRSRLAENPDGTATTPVIYGLPLATGGQLLIDLLRGTRRHVVGVVPFVNGAPDPAAAGRPLPVESAPAAGTTVPERASAGPRPAHPAAAPAAASDGQGAVASGEVPAIATALLGILSEVLGLETGTIDDDFFELGGNSLSAVTFMSAVENRLGVAVGIGSLFDHPTPRLMAQAIRDNGHE